MAGNRQVDFQSDLNLHGNQLREATLEIYDSESAIKAIATPVVEGRLVYAKDTGKIYTYHGSAWVTLTPIVGDANLANYVEKSVILDDQNKLKTDLLTFGITSGNLLKVGTDGLAGKTGDGFYLYAMQDGSVGAKSIAGVYRLKGSTNKAGLTATGHEVGDVYNCTEEVEVGGVTYPAGTNWVFVGTTSDDYGTHGLYNGWDPLGGVVDLSGYLTTKEIVSTITEDTGKVPSSKAVSDALATKVDKISGATGSKVVLSTTTGISESSITATDVGVLSGAASKLATAGDGTVAGYVDHMNTIVSEKQSVANMVKEAAVSTSTTEDEKYPSVKAAAKLASDAATGVKTEVSASIKEAKDIADGNTAAIAALTLKVQANEGKLAGVDSTVVDTINTSINTKLVDVKADIKSVQDKNEEQDADILDLKSKVGNATDGSTSGTLYGQIKGLKDADDELQQSIDDLSSRVMSAVDRTEFENALKDKADKASLSSALTGAYKVNVNTQGIVTGGSTDKLTKADLAGLASATEGQYVTIGSDGFVAKAAPVKVQEFTGSQTTADSDAYKWSYTLSPAPTIPPMISLYSVFGTKLTQVYTRIEYDGGVISVYFNKQPSTETFRLVIVSN